MTSHIRFNRLAAKSVKLGNSFPIMPIDEIRLSVAFAKLPDQEEVVSRLIRELFSHENMHVRRIAINACRRSGAFGVSGLKEALAEKLSDPEAWVRYDAAWAIEDAQFDSPEIRKKLTMLAANIKLPEDELSKEKNPSNADLQARVQARKTLDTIIKNGTNEA